MYHNQAVQVQHENSPKHRLLQRAYKRTCDAFDLEDEKFSIQI